MVRGYTEGESNRTALPLLVGVTMTSKSDFPSLSPTRLQSWLYCGMQYKFQYVDGHEEKPKKANAFGTIGHYILEQNTGELFKQGINSEFDALFYRKLNELKELGLEVEEDEVLTMRTEMGEIIFRFLKEQNFRQMEIVEREQTLEISFMGHIFEGTVDALVRFPTTPKDYVEIVDYKFGKRLQADSQLDRNIQQGLYYIAARNAGYKVHRNWWIHMRHFQPYKQAYRGKKKGDLRGVGFIPIAITDKDIPTVYNLAGPIIKAIEHEIFPPNSYGDACKNCQFTHLCPRYETGRDVKEEWVL